MRRRSLALLALASIVSPATADTFVVDDDGGPGVDFTDIPPAIQAADADDVLLVAPGSYSAFTMTEGVRVLGSAGAVVTGEVLVTDVVGGSLVVLADLELERVFVLDCDGTVLLANVTVVPGSTEDETIRIEGSFDVRLHETRKTYSNSGFQTGVLVVSSRAEVVQSWVEADRGYDADCGLAGNGGTALVVVTDSRVHVSRSTLLGGRGGDNSSFCGDFCGNGGGSGGNGLGANTSEIVVAGGVGDLIKGGRAGIGEICFCDGFGGDGVNLFSGSVRYSGVTLAGGDTLADCLSNGGLPLDLAPGASAESPRPADPTLELVGVPVQGGSVQVVLRGAPGANARLLMGRFAVVERTPGIEIERLTSEDRIVALEAIPASGSIGVNVLVPAVLPKGTAFFVQALTVREDGTTLRTSSVPLVVR